MLSKKTVELCIRKIDEEYKNTFRQVTNSETWMSQREELLYMYEHALYELKNELQSIEEENLSD